MANAISFHPSCFQRIGTRTEFVVLRSAIHSGPAIFTDQAEAEELARRTGREVMRREVPLMKRIKWTDD